MNKTCAIYCLIGPGGEIRYVGKAKDPHKRLRQHLSARGYTPVAHWIAKLARSGMKPSMRILEWAENWEQAERNYIASYRLHHNLLNLADGGAGASGVTEQWQMKSALRYARDLLDRVKPYERWINEENRTGCEILMRANVINGLLDIRRKLAPAMP